jgi:hypothetical protein
MRNGGSLVAVRPEAFVYRNGKEEIVPPEGALEDPEILPGFSLPLSEVLGEAEQE